LMIRESVIPIIQWISKLFGYVKNNKHIYQKRINVLVNFVKRILMIFVDYFKRIIVLSWRAIKWISKFFSYLSHNRNVYQKRAHVLVIAITYIFRTFIHYFLITSELVGNMF